MSSYLSWEHEFCLACDRQTDGAAYCSESCRLSDVEKSSTVPAAPTNGTMGHMNSASTFNAARSQTQLCLSPAYDFQNAKPYGSTPLPPSYLTRRDDSSTAPSIRILTPSSSHSSLSSMRSSSTMSGENSQLSDKARKQLRDYASSFENARLQRRRSY